MGAFSNFCQVTEQTSVAHFMHGFTWLFPAVETIHLAAMVVMVGCITAFDLRLLHVVLRQDSVSEIAEQCLPATWAAFAIMVATGFLLFASDPVSKYGDNPAFRIKLLLILLARLNMSVFHLAIHGKASGWDDQASPPLWARCVGSFSVILWAGVIIAGRWIGFA